MKQTQLPPRDSRGRFISPRQSEWAQIEAIAPELIGDFSNEDSLILAQYRALSNYALEKAGWEISFENHERALALAEQDRDHYKRQVFILVILFLTLAFLILGVVLTYFKFTLWEIITLYVMGTVIVLGVEKYAPKS
jgi:hypothetical protein